MGKQTAEKFDDDDYFDEPDYDKLSDADLDDLYNFGEIRNTPVLTADRTIDREMDDIVVQLFDDADVIDEDWMDADLDIDLSDASDDDLGIGDDLDIDDDLGDEFSTI